VPAPESRSPRAGFVFALAAYLTWGIFPLYFKALKQVPPPEILAHRVVWSAVFLSFLVTATRRWRELRAAVRPARRIGVYLLSTLLITTNWLLYIWAVNSGQVLEASLGYFINPLVNVLLGVVLLDQLQHPCARLCLGERAVGGAPAPAPPSTPTTRRSPSRIQDAGAPRAATSGRSPAMTAPGAAAPARRPLFIPMHRGAAPSMRWHCSPAIKASCNATAIRPTSNWLIEGARAMP